MVDIEGEDKDILERFDFELDDLIDRESFAKALNERLHLRQDPDATINQTSKFFDIFDITISKFPTKDIKTIKFNLYGKPQVRFNIPKHSGLFGIQKALSFFKTGKI